MKSMDGTTNNAHYSLDCYIKTKPTAFLAILKAIEIILAAYGLYLLLGTDLHLANVFNDFTRSLNGMSAYSSMLTAESVVIKVATWVSIVGLGLIILDSICVILLRITGRFSSVIRLIHTLIFIAMILAFAMAILGIVEMIRSIEKNGPDINAFSRAFTLSYSGLALAGIGLTFGYHWGIASVMRTIGIERRTGEKRIVKQSALPRLCRYYAWVTAIPVVLIAASWVLKNFVNLPANSVLNEIIRIVSFIENTDPTSVIAEVGLGVFFTIKFALVGSCAKVYNIEHI